MSGPDAIEFVVKGLPPKKSEAKSLFAADHPKADRVTALLKAAVRRDFGSGSLPRDPSSSRAAATHFAMQHALVGSFEGR